MAAKDTYHHGNLRRALLDAALAVIADKGVEGLSLREVSSRVGVSHTAPYHHFADKTALVHALAHEGMALMDERMAAAEREAGDDPKKRLLGIGMAYVTFAVERPDYYAAFNAPEVNNPEAQVESEQPDEAQGNTWQRLLDAIIACQQAGELPQGDPVVLGVYLWSLVHGLAELWRSGPLSLMPQAADGLEPLAHQVLSAALGSMEAAAEKDTAPAWRPCPKEEPTT
jgi:AcrR family transcriptional regulator